MVYDDITARLRNRKCLLSIFCSLHLIVRSTLFIAVLLLACLYLFDVRAEMEQPVRSSELHQLIVNDGNTIRIDYVNENGAITYAADLFYATLIRTKRESTETDRFFDAEGNPSRHRLGYYEIQREYNERGECWKTTYLDADHIPVICGSGYAMVVRTFDDNGRLCVEHYLDTQGNPIKTDAYGYGNRKEYDEQGRNTTLIYLDRCDQPMITSQGFAILHRFFYEWGDATGRVSDEFYCDSDDKPVMRQRGQYGVHKEYDDLGRTAVVTDLGADGLPFVNRKGYTTVRRTFYADDTIATEMYFDLQGNPVSLSEGQYGIKYLKNGHLVYLDQSGREMISLRNMLYNRRWLVVLITILSVICATIAGKRTSYLFFAMCLSAVVYMTLLFRSTTLASIGNISMITKNRVLFSFTNIDGVIDNILLFIPLGATVRRMNPRIYILLVPLLLSITIEITQLILGIGFCDLMDVLSNSFGGLIGFISEAMLEKLIQMLKRKKRVPQ